MTIYSGKTIQDAVEQSLADLSLTQDQVEVKILQQPRHGFFGIGRKLAKVDVKKKKNTNQNQTITNQKLTEAKSNTNLSRPDQADNDVTKKAVDLEKFLNN